MSNWAALRKQLSSAASCPVKRNACTSSPTSTTTTTTTTATTTTTTSLEKDNNKSNNKNNNITKSSLKSKVADDGAQAVAVDRPTRTAVRKHKAAELVDVVTGPLAKRLRTVEDDKADKFLDALFGSSKRNKPDAQMDRVKVQSKNRRIKSTRHVEPATNDSSSNCLSDSALNAMPSDASDADIAVSTYQEPREMDLELKEEKNKQLHILESILKSPESNTLSTLIDSGSIIKTKTDSSAVVSDKARTKVGKYLAVDCEMVGVGLDGVQSALARVSIVNFFGTVILDTFVKPLEKVTDYRTHVSGITPELLDASKNPRLRGFKEVQVEVAALMKDKVVIGHALKNDMRALLLNHPRRLVRDTSQYHEFRALAKGRSPALRKLAKHYLGIDIQGGEHSSVEDAQVTMELYKIVRNNWEKIIKSKGNLHEDG